MAYKPASGLMRTLVEYGKVTPVFTTDGSFKSDFVVEGTFWADKLAVGSTERGDVVRAIDGVDITDDITTLRTWAGLDITTDYRFRIKGTMYSILGIAVSDDDRMVDYRATSGLRDTKG